jgi:CPA1 family monovalent cation:H+ antiporter
VQQERERSIAHALAAIREQYPEYSRALDRAYLERCAIRQERESYDSLQQNAIIGSELHQSLIESLEERYKALSSQPELDLGLTPGQLVPKVPLFADLPTQQQLAIAKLLRPRLAVPGEVIIRKDEPGDSMYFVSSGAVRVDIEPHSAVLGTGGFFGEMALVNDAPRTADVSAIAFCDLLVLSKRDFERLATVDEDIRQKIEAVARERSTANRLS